MCVATVSINASWKCDMALHIKRTTVSYVFLTIFKKKTKEKIC
jgi:hypothetical protein